MLGFRDEKQKPHPNSLHNEALMDTKSLMISSYMVFDKLYGCTKLVHMRVFYLLPTLPIRTYVAKQERHFVSCYTAIIHINTEWCCANCSRVRIVHLIGPRVVVVYVYDWSDCNVLEMWSYVVEYYVIMILLGIMHFNKITHKSHNSTRRCWFPSDVKHAYVQYLLTTRPNTKRNNCSNIIWTYLLNIFTSFRVI